MAWEVNWYYMISRLEVEYVTEYDRVRMRREVMDRFNRSSVAQEIH